QNCKRLLVEAFGGGCQLCGYRRCLRALEFHHLDGTTKEFTISQWRTTTSWTKITREASRCVLVCSNCHAEIEEGLVTISDVVVQHSREIEMALLEREPPVLG